MTEAYMPVVSKSTDWGTPRALFDKLDKEFNFTLDPCASLWNAKCDNFHTEHDNGLSYSWGCETVFMNPPYGRGLDKWVEKAHQTMSQHNILRGYHPTHLVVGLLPARTDVKWFHNYVWDREKNQPQYQVEVRFLKGRLKFELEAGIMDAAPFPSMIVIWR